MQPSTPLVTDMGPGPFVGDTVAKSTEDSLDALFAAASSAAFNQPWQKLDRGAKLDRLRKFVIAYPGLSPAERASLLSTVLQAFELRSLNSKSSVDYNPDLAVIVMIRGLRERVGTNGLRTFRIDPTTVIRSTQRQRKGAATAAATSKPQDLNILTTDTSKEAQ